MNKIFLHTALLTLSFPFSIYGLGLGQMTVKSSLDQPFLAEIDLIDVGNLPITSIKVGVADPENFEEIGLDRAAVLSLLNFKIEKNSQGKLAIIVRSTERMVDPYMELVVDMAWPKGQLYKAYTVLLDPPGYQLVLTTIQGSPARYRKTTTYSNEPGVINKTIHTTVAHKPPVINDRKKETTYGPTISNENVWQIAQRYKTSEIILPQIVLAIVGTNPDAFKDGNLNGLKVGVRLVIPATQDINQVPVELATEEVMAHDKAWSEKSVINHIINPPYINAAKSTEHHSEFMPKNEHTPLEKANSSLNSSEIPVIPHFNAQSIIDAMPQLIPTNTIPVQTNKIPQSSEQYSKTKAELDIATAAVESVRESNALLMEQLRLLQAQNKQLQQQLQQRDQQIEQMRIQIQDIVKQRLAIAAQTSSPNTDHSSLLWPILLMLLAAGGGAFAYWYFRIRETEDETITYTSEPLMDPKINSLSTDENNTVDDPITASTGGTVVAAQVNDLHKQSKNQLEDETKEIASDSPILNTQSAAVLHQAEFQKPVNDSGFSKISESPAVLEDTDETKISDTTKHIETSSIDARIKAPLEEQLAPAQTAAEKPGITPQVPEEYPQEEEQLLEFESGLHELITKKPAAEHSSEAKSEEYEGLDFTPSKLVTIPSSQPDSYEPSADPLNPVEQKPDEELNLPELDPDVTEFFAQHNLNDTSESINLNEHTESLASDSADEVINPLKSTKALDTLLALARTYASMDDFESARSSLEEVVSHGSEKQKQDALRLLEDIKNK